LVGVVGPAVSAEIAGREYGVVSFGELLADYAIEGAVEQSAKPRPTITFNGSLFISIPLQKAFQ
jgi:hypothetical protein